MNTSNIKIEYIKISELKFADYNPRKATEKEFKNLRDNIEKFGFVDPVLVNSNPARKNIIIGGHFRTRVAKDLGYTEVPVVFLDIESEEREKELNVRLNKNTGSFDFDILGNMFEVDFLEGIGFEPFELGIVDIPTGKENKTEIDSGSLGEYSIITLKYPNDKYLEILDLLHQAKDGEGFITNEELIENLLKGNV